MDLERFYLIDRLVEISPSNGTILCAGKVPEASLVFEGHFPGRPIVPGVLQTEMMAQSAALFIWLTKQPLCMPILVGLEHARFRQPLLPGAEVAVSAHLGFSNSTLAQFRCEVAQGSTRTSSADIRLSLSQFDNEEMRGFAARRVTHLCAGQRTAAVLALEENL